MKKLKLQKRLSIFLIVVFAIALVPVEAVLAQFGGGGTAISTFIYPATPQLENIALDIEHISDNVLRRVGTYNVVDTERVLNAEGIKENALRIEYAQQSFNDGKSAFEALDLGAAQEKFMEAVAFYEQALGYLPQDGGYETTLMYLGASAAMQGDVEFAKVQFRKLSAISPDFQPDTSVFLEDVQNIFSESRSDLANLPPGQLELTSIPASIEVYIDGSYAGVTPLSLPLVASEHLIIGVRKGYVRQGEFVKVETGSPTRHTLKLSPTPQYRMLAGSLDRAKAEYSRRQVGQGIAGLCQWLQLQQVILGDVAFSADQVTLNVALFDTPSGKMLSQRTQTFYAQSQNVKVEIDRFIESFITSTPAPGEVEMQQQMAQQIAQSQQYEEVKKKEEANRNKKITDEWWFWPAVGGGGALLVGGAVIAIMALSGGSSAPEPSPNGTLVITY